VQALPNTGGEALHEAVREHMAHRFGVVRDLELAWRTPQYTATTGPAGCARCAPSCRNSTGKDRPAP
jgi:hypothetical protein